MEARIGRNMTTTTIISGTEKPGINMLKGMSTPPQIYLTFLASLAWKYCFGIHRVLHGLPIILQNLMLHNLFLCFLPHISGKVDERPRLRYVVAAGSLVAASDIGFTSRALTSMVRDISDTCKST